MPLEDLRRHIDALDDRILALLEERADVAAEIAAAKRAGGLAIHDPARERAVLQRLAERGAGRFPREAIAGVYREIMSACVAVQAPVTVAFLGPEGTFTHIAARSLYGLAARYTEAATIEGVFDAIRRGVAAYGVVPIENSTEGSVTHSVDALLEGGVLIRGELVLDVAQCLLGLPAPSGMAASLTTIERVYSHPQALAQCRAWLAKHLARAQLVQTASTAAAAREAALDPAGAAIGSRLAAELHGLTVILPRIQDRAENATRFVVIAREDAPRTGDDKTAVGFTLRDERGALHRVLGSFDEAGVNLSRIESRPSQKQAWEYAFLVEIEGHREDEAIARVLDRLRAQCESARVLGSFPRDRRRGDERSSG